MTFWDWCHEHYVFTFLIVIFFLMVIDSAQANYFKTKGK